MKRGFITLIGILIAVLIMGIWFVKVYSTSDSSSPDKKTQMDTYKDAIDDAESVKNLMERKNIEI